MRPRAILFCISALALSAARAELFTAQVHLHQLLRTEEQIVKTLEEYLNIEETRLNEVKQIRSQYEQLHRAASRDASSFLSNPVNAFLIIKRLTTDWQAAKDVMVRNHSQVLIESISSERWHFPDEEDLSGAAAALFRLQNTYLLNISNLVEGRIEGTNSSAELTAGDCLELGKQAFVERNYLNAALWMREALRRMEGERPDDRIYALECLAYASFVLGNADYSLKLTKDVLMIEPSHERARENLEIYRNAAGGERAPSEAQPNFLDDRFLAQSATSSRFGNYERLCRGERLKSAAEESKLRCRYVTNGDAWLLLQPEREEELHLRPRVSVFRRFLSDREIGVIQELAEPKLKRALVYNTNIGDRNEAVTYRISKNAWLRDHKHAVVRAVSRRVSAVTGLTLDTAEPLQVVNYGIGGHYDPHVDFAGKNEDSAFNELGTGNRMATWLNYMSDVEAGGSTVFTQIGVEVRPEKGSAAFWYNLHESGEGDHDTKHAACPVLAGSKWVSNKWIHEKGQEFRRPCKLG